MRRLKALTTLALLSLLAGAAPALAGPQETALIQKFQGNWAGTGKVTGTSPGNVTCRLQVQAAKDGNVNYSGRCSFSAGATTFRGTLAYNDAKKRFESTANTAGISTTAIGKRQGNGVVFATKGLKTQIGTVDSTMAFSGNRITLDFKAMDRRGTTTSSRVDFSRS